MVAEVLSNTARTWWGVLGSLLAVLVKFHGQDLHWVHVHLDTHAYDRLMNLVIVYVLMLLILLPVGAIVAAASREHSRAKILMMAVAAPALVTTWAGGDKTAKTFSLPQITELVWPIGTAYAADQSASPSGISLKDGFSQFFGFNKDSGRYYVIAGPYKNENEASEAGKKLMQSRPSLSVFLGDSDKKTGAASLIIGQSLPYLEATKFRDVVKDIPELKVKDVYLTATAPSAALNANAPTR